MGGLTREAHLENEWPDETRHRFAQSTAQSGATLRLPGLGNPHPGESQVKGSQPLSLSLSPPPLSPLPHLPTKKLILTLRVNNKKATFFYDFCGVQDKGPRTECTLQTLLLPKFLRRGARVRLSSDLPVRGASPTLASCLTVWKEIPAIYLFGVCKSLQVNLAGF